MLTAQGYLADAGSVMQLIALCPACAGRQSPDRRQPTGKRLRELVAVTRLLAWQAQDSADFADEQGRLESARVLRELAAAADSAIEALRINHQEP